MTEGSASSTTVLINPADETVIREVPHTTIEEVDAAVLRAVAMARTAQEATP